MTVAETASSVDLTQLLSELGFVFFFFTREEFVTFCLICSSSDLASVSRTLFFFFFPNNVPYTSKLLELCVLLHFCKVNSFFNYYFILFRWTNLCWNWNAVATLVVLLYTLTWMPSMQLWK